MTKGIAKHLCRAAAFVLIMAACWPEPANAAEPRKVLLFIGLPYGNFAYNFHLAAQVLSKPPYNFTHENMIFLLTPTKEAAAKGNSLKALNDFPFFDDSIIDGPGTRENIRAVFERLQVELVAGDLLFVVFDGDGSGFTGEEYVRSFIYGRQPDHIYNDPDPDPAFTKNNYDDADFRESELKMQFLTCGMRTKDGKLDSCYERGVGIWMPEFAWFDKGPGTYRRYKIMPDGRGYFNRVLNFAKADKNTDGALSAEELTGLDADGDKIAGMHRVGSIKPDAESIAWWKQYYATTPDAVKVNGPKPSAACADGRRSQCFDEDDWSAQTKVEPYREVRMPILGFHKFCLFEGEGGHLAAIADPPHWLGGSQAAAVRSAYSRCVQGTASPDELGPHAIMRDADNNGYADYFDINLDGDLNDWIGVDERVGAFRDDEFAGFFSGFGKGVKKLFFTSSCYGGGVLDDLAKHGVTGISASTAVDTAASSVLLQAFFFVLNGKCELFGAPEFNRLADGRSTTPACEFVQIRPDLDRNNDRRISVAEALAAAGAATNHGMGMPGDDPQLEDNGDGVSTSFRNITFEGCEENRDGCNANSLFLADAPFSRPLPLEQARASRYPPKTVPESRKTHGAPRTLVKVGNEIYTLDSAGKLVSSPLR